MYDLKAMLSRDKVTWAPDEPCMPRNGGELGASTQRGRFQGYSDFGLNFTGFVILLMQCQRGPDGR